MSLAPELVQAAAILRTATWPTRVARVLRLVGLLAAVALVAVVLTVGLPLSGQVILLAVLVAFVGMPHGGLDHLVGRVLCRPVFGRAWPIYFFAWYLAVAALVVVGWLSAPIATMTLFFLLSALHFAQTERDHPLLAVVFGGMVIWVPMLAQPEAVARLLDWITPAAQAEEFRWAMDRAQPMLVMLAVLAGGVWGWRILNALSQGRPQQLAETLTQIGYAGLLVFAPVLVSFTIYFCARHSARELRHLAEQANPGDPAAGLHHVLRVAAPMSLGAVVLTLAGAWLWHDGTGAEPAVGADLFLGPSAVAVPHILLHWLADSQQVGPFTRLAEEGS